MQSRIVLVLVLVLVLVTACAACAANDGDSSSKTPPATPTQPSAAAGNGDEPAAEPSFGNPQQAQKPPSGPAQGGTAAPAPPSSAGKPNASSILRGSCASAAVQSELLPSNVLIVLDRSGSMICNPPPTTASADCEAAPMRAAADEPSKWEITTAALVDALEGLPANASVGLAYFSNNQDCGVNSIPSVALAPNTGAQRKAISNSLATVQPGGGTPIVGATILAYKYLHEAALAGAITGSEFVVLITDGAQSESCSNPPECDGADSCTDLLADREVPKAAGAGVGIHTFVIGVPGSEPARTALSRIAKNGGTAPADCDVDKGDCHFDMTAVDDLGEALGQALTEIAAKTLSCELDLPKPEDGELDLAKVNVVYSPANAEPSLFFQDTSAPCDGGADGWQYTDANTKIRLCGHACETARADVGGRIDVVLGCPVQGPQ